MWKENLFLDSDTSDLANPDRQACIEIKLGEAFASRVVTMLASLGLPAQADADSMSQLQLLSQVIEHHPSSQRSRQRSH
jgi:hypothetical protein